MRYVKAWVIAGVLTAWAGQAWAQGAFETYVVEEGDTCTSIAYSFYGDARAYHHIHRYNDLSEDGYACREGRALRMPILPEEAEAKLAARAGKVRAKPPAAGWDAVDVGAEFFKAWRVNTLERSRAELDFRQSSRLQMTENTLVVIYGPSKENAERTVMRRASVDKGRLKTSLAALTGSKVRVETPEASAELGAGRAQVTVAEGESRVANHGGEPIAVASAAGAGGVAVDAGYGTRVRRGKPPEKPRPLPDTPTWRADFEPRALALVGSPASVRAAWEPVAQAAAYYVEVSRTRKQLDVLFAERVSADIEALEMRGLPAGEYVVSIVAIDEDEFESIPSKLVSLQVHELGVPAGQVIDAEEGAVLLGATLRAPSEFVCALEGAEEARVVVLGSVGRQVVSCRGESYEVSAELEVVSPVAESTSTVEVTQGSLTAVEVEFEPALPPDVSATTSAEGLEVKPMQVGPGTLRVNMSVAPGAPVGRSEVQLRYGDVRLGGFDVEVTGADSVAAQASSPQRAEYLLTAMVGLDAVSVDPYWRGEPTGGGATVELGLGTAPTDHFAAEARVGMALHAGAGLSAVSSARAQALAGWFQAPLGVHGGVGLSWQQVLGSESGFSPRVSVGVMPTLGERWRVRGEVSLDATPRGGELRYLPAARAGVSLRF